MYFSMVNYQILTSQSNSGGSSVYLLTKPLFSTVHLFHILAEDLPFHFNLRIPQFRFLILSFYVQICLECLQNGQCEYEHEHQFHAKQQNEEHGFSIYWLRMVRTKDS